MKASACHHTLHANHWHCLWKFPPIIAVKSNVTTFIQVLRFVVNMFYCGRVTFIIFKHADTKGVRQCLMSTASLDDGYCEATIPVVKGHHVTQLTMAGARETALASSTYAPFTWRLLTFTGWNWKCHVIIVIKTDLLGFVVPMHSGLCEQYVKSCFARALVHWDNKPLQNRS